MFRSWTLLSITAGYLSLLFLIAWYAARREQQGRSIVSNPYIYSLSLAVYCTSWTFYGSVGKAATSGLSFLTIYIGPTLMVSLWWVVLRKMINIARENRITTIADFIGSRYGNSVLLSALITVVAAVGITPYLGLQIKAIIGTFTIMAGQTEGSIAAGWIITLIIGIFAMSFGVRRSPLSEKHEGLVFAIAFESIIKLLAFLLVGLYVTYVLFGGPFDIFQKIQATEFRNLLGLGQGSTVSFSGWASLIFLSMMAIMFLPRQFHMAVVENYETSHLSKAMWLFPLYLFLINIFVLPVAFGGLLLGGSPQGSDSFVLTIPLGQGKSYLALFVFLGGFSAASGMIIVESLAISNMVMNSIVNPAIYRYNKMKGFSLILANIKRLVILGLVFIGYIFAVSIGEFYSLVDIGLKSFEAVTIFAPSILLGLYWKRGNRNGAIAGVIAGFFIWGYTLIIPALIKSGILEEAGVLYSITHSHMLNPNALFGLEGLDKWTHSLFWSLFFNVVLYVGVSIFTSQSEQEERQALLFVESYSLKVPSAMSSVSEMEGILVEYIGTVEAARFVEEFLSRHGTNREAISEKDLTSLRHEAQRTLSGVVGSATASIVFEDRLTRTEQERAELLDSLKQMGRTLRLSRQELAEANRQLAALKEFSENIIESLPLGVATLDEHLRVKYWNMAMETITGVEKPAALNARADRLLACLSPDIFTPELQEGGFDCSIPSAELKGYISRLTGAQRGYVVVLEDITEKKKIEEELFRATKHASIGRLAAGVSHEVGNPLASISSLVQELLAEEGSPFLHESLATINRHVERIAKIVRNLGDFARLYPRQKQPTSLKETLENTLNLVRYDKNFRNIGIHTDVQEIPRLRMDTDQIQQVLLNLLLNARDAMPEGGELHISITQSDGTVEMVFTDTGRGVDERIKDKIFDPFFSTKGPAKGTGLGLSVCYSIIKDHGGTIQVKQGEDHGASFIIRLPVHE
jgi:Na+/proline symporter/nitrogen-specific signal transduction histidine kinase